MRGIGPAHGDRPSASTRVIQDYLDRNRLEWMNECLLPLFEQRHKDCQALTAQTEVHVDSTGSVGTIPAAVGASLIQGH